MKANTLYKMTVKVSAAPPYGDELCLHSEAVRYVRVDSEVQLAELLARVDLACQAVLVKPK